MKKILSLIIIFVLLLFILSTQVKVDATEYNYVDPDQEFRGVWVTPWGGDSTLVTYNSEAGFKSNMEYIFTIMEENNMNSLIFHIRTHNNAMYKSSLNPVATYWSKVNFNTFDPLEWLISECHKRGIEFHAWLNPYRCGTNHVGSYNNNNPASDSANTLTYNSNTILNPGLPVVREFIRDTVLEILENYDVDAIHFDDYFYINMGANGALTGATTILDEPDQTTYETYIDNNPSCGYSKSSAQNKADWRRTQVDELIEMLHDAIADYNETNNKYVQLGIAPTGVYKNGNGVVTYDGNGMPITTGSNTGGQTHYSSYLFCDTLKWCKEGWIDYILPQTYWATNHSVCPYKTLVSWWARALKYLPVNFYSGIGLYMAENESAKNWYTDPDELYNQLNYLSTLDNAKGASIYNFATLRKKHDGTASNANQQVANLGTHAWTRKVVQPELKSFNSVNLGEVPNFVVNDKTLSWNHVDGAKFYCIYKNRNDVLFDSSELVAVVGNSINTWTDTESGYHYGIRALSYTNTLGAFTYEPNTISIANGAAMRTVGEHQGLKFNARLSDLPENSERGFFLVKGTHTKDELVNAITNLDSNINGDKIVKKPIEGTDLDISVVVYNIGVENYNTNITAMAYVKLANGTYRFSSVVVRNLSSVALAAYQNGNREDLVVEVYNHSNIEVTYYLNSNGYHDINTLANDFICDFNVYASSSLTKETFRSADRNKLVEFMSTSSYAAKWNWLFTSICELRHTYQNEIEEFAAINYQSYSANSNKNYYTPYMERLIDGEEGLDSGRRLWVLELYALFNSTYDNYFNAHTLNYSASYADEARNTLLDIRTKTEAVGNTPSITPTRGGYVFGGWYLSNDGGTTLSSRVDNIGIDTTDLYAKWN